MIREGGAIWDMSERRRPKGKLRWQISPLSAQDKMDELLGTRPAQIEPDFDEDGAARARGIESVRVVMGQLRAMEAVKCAVETRPFSDADMDLIDIQVELDPRYVFGGLDRLGIQVKTGRVGKQELKKEIWKAMHSYSGWQPWDEINERVRENLISEWLLRHKLILVTVRDFESDREMLGYLLHQFGLMLNFWRNQAYNSPHEQKRW